MRYGLLLWCTLLFSCSERVVNYIDTRARFQSFETYDLVNVKLDKRKVSPNATKLLGLIEDRIIFQMEANRGYEESNINPDLVLRYELVSNTRSEVRNNVGFFYPTTTSQLIYESVILLELFHEKKLIWQGSYDLTQTRRSERNEKSIQKAIDLIFTSYPYRAGKADPDPSLTSKIKK